MSINNIVYIIVLLSINLLKMEKINILDSRIQQLQLELEQTKLECEQEEIHKRESKIKMEPNLNMMSEWLQNLDIMREYYDIDKHQTKDEIDNKHLLGQRSGGYESHVRDPKIEWLSAINSCAETGRFEHFRRLIEDHPKMLEFMSKPIAQRNKKDYLKIINEIQNEIKEEYQQKKRKLELSKLTIGSKQTGILISDLPSEFMINFIESTYNMFNILNDRIKKLEENIKVL